MLLPFSYSFFGFWGFPPPPIPFQNKKRDARRRGLLALCAANILVYRKNYTSFRVFCQSPKDCVKQTKLASLFSRKFIESAKTHRFPPRGSIFCLTGAVRWCKILQKESDKDVGCWFTLLPSLCRFFCFVSKKRRSSLCVPLSATLAPV